MAGVDVQLLEVSGTEIGQSVLFPIAPEVLHRIQLRSIAGEEFHPEAVFLRGDEVLDQVASVRRQPVPDHHDLAVDVAEQMREELHDLRCPDRPGEQAEVEVPYGHAGHRREQVPVEVELKDRRLASRRPGPTAVRPLRQSALVGKDDRAALAESPLFIAGQRVRFQ